VAGQNASRDVVGHLVGFALARFQFVKRAGAQLMARGVLLIKAADAGVKVPAVIIEFLGYSFYIIERFLFKVFEADDHIGHLHAGVIYIVLGFHLFTCGAEQSDGCISEHGVAKVAYVGGLVGIDCGVLDYDFAAKTRRHRFRVVCCGEQIVGPVQIDIYVARACDLNARYAFEVSQLFCEASGQFSRIVLLAGRGFQSLCKLEGYGESQIAHLGSRRYFKRDIRYVYIECFSDGRAQPLAH